MEAFSLLKYWRGGGGGGGGDATAPAATTDTTSTAAAAATTAILTAVAQNDVEETDDDDSDSEDDDGPFFDLEFTLPDDSQDSPQNLNEEDHTASDADNHSDDQENINNNNNNDNNDNSSEDSEGDEEGESEREIKFTLSASTSSNDRSDPNLSDDVVFKGELVQLEPSSFVLNSSEPNSKPQFTARASLLKSATKFRVFMLGLKKPNKPSAASEKDPNGSDPGAPNPKQQRKLFTVKFKVEEVPIMSLLFTRSDNSSKGGKAASAAAATSANSKEDSQTQSSHSSSASEEKRLMRKYLRMVKPLYVKVSRKYAEKLRFSGQLNMTASASASAPTAKEKEKEKEGDNIAAAAPEAAGTNGKGQKQGNLPLPAGLRVVCKHLGKSRSASSVAAPGPASASAPDPARLASSKRRDDSLLQQQDGIQGAILHCKRSFNASRDQCESSQLPRSVSDPLHEVSPELSRKSANEGNDKRP